MKLEDFMDEKDLIKKFGLSLDAIAKESGASKATISLITNNKTEGFRPETIEKVQQTIARMIVDKNGGARREAV